MKRRIILIAVLSVFVFSLSTVYAQGPGKGMGRGHGMGMGIMSDEDFPELTKDQRDQMADLRAEYQKAMIPIQANLKMLRLEMRELLRNDASQSKLDRKIEEIGALKIEIRKMQLDHRLRMKDVLTDEQIEYLESHRGMRHGMMKNFRQGRGDRMGNHCRGMMGMNSDMDEDFDRDEYSFDEADEFMSDCPMIN